MIPRLYPSQSAACVVYWHLSGFFFFNQDCRHSVRRHYQIHVVSHCSGYFSSGRLGKHCFNSWNARLHSSLQGCTLCKTLKIARHLSVDLNTNLFKAATRPANRWVLLMFCGGFMFMIALILSVLASNPLSNTIMLENFPECTLKVHFARFNFMLYWCSTTKYSLKSAKCWADS